MMKKMLASLLVALLVMGMAAPAMAYSPWLGASRQFIDGLGKQSNPWIGHVPQNDAPEYSHVQTSPSDDGATTLSTSLIFEINRRDEVYYNVKMLLDILAKRDPNHGMLEMTAAEWVDVFDIWMMAFDMSFDDIIEMIQDNISSQFTEVK